MLPADANGLAELLSDPGTYPFLSHSGPVPRGKVPGRIRRYRWATWLGRAAYWSIEFEGEFVGYVALHAAPGRRIALSYAVRPTWRRRGVARESIEAVLAYTRSVTRDTTIVARTHCGNAPSAALLERVGFTDAGTVRTPLGVRREFHWPAASR